MLNDMEIIKVQARRDGALKALQIPPISPTMPVDARNELWVYIVEWLGVRAGRVDVMNYHVEVWLPYDRLSLYPGDWLVVRENDVVKIVDEEFQENYERVPEPEIVPTTPLTAERIFTPGGAEVSVIPSPEHLSERKGWGEGKLLVFKIPNAPYVHYELFLSNANMADLERMLSKGRGVVWYNSEDRPMPWGVEQNGSTLDFTKTEDD